MHPVWVVTAALDEQTLYPVAVLRGEMNPRFHIMEFHAWCAELESSAGRQTMRKPLKTYKARKAGAYTRGLLNSGIKPEWINGETTRVFAGWLIKFRGYKHVKHTEVPVKIN